MRGPVTPNTEDMAQFMCNMRVYLPEEQQSQNHDVQCGPSGKNRSQTRVPGEDPNHQAREDEAQIVNHGIAHSGQYSECCSSLRASKGGAVTKLLSRGVAWPVSRPLPAHTPAPLKFGRSTSPAFQDLIQD
jgi:hypothetical protein